MRDFFIEITGYAWGKPWTKRQQLETMETSRARDEAPLKPSLAKMGLTHSPTHKDCTMTCSPLASRFSVHGALMDPDYLRESQNRYATQGKAEVVQRAALALVFLLPAGLWVASKIAGLWSIRMNALPYRVTAIKQG
jgi:hypothetical protein